jgi:hypothetical protein
MIEQPSFEVSFPPLRITLDEDHGLPAGVWDVNVVATDGVDILCYQSMGDLVTVSINHLKRIELTSNEYWRVTLGPNGHLIGQKLDGANNSGNPISFGPLRGQMDRNFNLEDIKKDLLEATGAAAKDSSKDVYQSRPGEDDPELDEELMCPTLTDDIDDEEEEENEGDEEDSFILEDEPEEEEVLVAQVSDVTTEEEDITSSPTEEEDLEDDPPPVIPDDDDTDEYTDEDSRLPSERGWPDTDSIMEAQNEPDLNREDIS